jgi:hypothetical protein
MDMESFARFWRARDRLQWAIRTTRDQGQMELEVTSDERIEGLTFEFQRQIAEVKGDAKLLADRRRILLPRLETRGRIQIRIQFQSGQ